MIQTPSAVYCEAASFGGTSIVWDIGDWLASLERWTLTRGQRLTTC